MQQREVNGWCKQIYDHEDLHSKQIFLSLNFSKDLQLYSSAFDFVVYLYVDISKDKKIRDSMVGEKEQELINDLWDNHNVLFQVV